MSGRFYDVGTLLIFDICFSGGQLIKLENDNDMVEISNLTRRKIDGRFLCDIAKIVLKEENREELDVSIGIVGKEEIRKLNKKYRGKNRPTDVLSFLYLPGGQAGESFGEIVICPEIIEKNAKKYVSFFEKELARVLIHGILHLLGYNHEKSEAKAKKMAAKESYYLRFIK